MKRRLLQLSKPEIQSGFNRQQWAEGLILQLPENHDGRNSWLMNYGQGEEAKALRDKRDIPWVRRTQSAEAPPRQIRWAT